MSLRPSMSLMFCLVMMACVLEVISEECVDKDPKCATYYKGHCSYNKKWGMKMCTRFCNYCGCDYDGKTYKHGEKFTTGCIAHTCENGAVSGVPRSCSFFQLPDPKCSWYTPDDVCCSVPICPRGITIEYPAWWAGYKKYIAKDDY